MLIFRKLALVSLLLGVGLISDAIAQDYIIFNGGITRAERQAAPENGTKLVFFIQAGNFLSDVKVVIFDEANTEIVNTVSDGPWLILDLPDGRYKVTASVSNGETQSVEFSVDGSNQEIGLMFTTVE